MSMNEVHVTCEGKTYTLPPKLWCLEIVIKEVGEEGTEDTWGVAYFASITVALACIASHGPKVQKLELKKVDTVKTTQDFINMMKHGYPPEDVCEVYESLITQL